MRRLFEANRLDGVQQIFLQHQLDWKCTSRWVAFVRPCGHMWRSMFLPCDLENCRIRRTSHSHVLRNAVMIPSFQSESVFTCHWLRSSFHSWPSTKPMCHYCRICLQIWPIFSIHFWHVLWIGVKRVEIFLSSTHPRYRVELLSSSPPGLYSIQLLHSFHGRTYTVQIRQCAHVYMCQDTCTSM